MNDLEIDILREIEENGYIPINQFIKIIASDRVKGYYSNVEAIGQKGDFITAPEISQLFSEILGIWCINFWHHLGKPANFSLVELGPGNGTLSHDILLTAGKIAPDFLEACDLHLVELDNQLRLKQKQTLDKFSTIKQEWHHDLSSLPNITSIFIANEFFDALPITQYIKREHDWREIVIILSKQKELIFSDIAIDPKTSDWLCKEYPDVLQGSIIEICEEGEIIIKQIADHIQKYNGGALLIDYGYLEGKDRLLISSLQAVKKHQYWPIFKELGTSDISSHVNFSALGNAASLHNVAIHGPISQRDFLLNMQIEARKNKLLKQATPHQRKNIESGYHRLIDLHQMGMLFKTIGITRHDFRGFIGFE